MRLRMLVVAVALAVGGCQGPAGPAGPQGPPGPQGTSGASIVESFWCDGPVDLGDGRRLLRHIVYFTSDGGSLATCSVFYPGQQVLGFIAYPSTHPGAKAAGCNVIADLDGSANGAYWTMYIDTSHDTGKATLTDVGANNGRAVTLTCTRV